LVASRLTESQEAARSLGEPVPFQVGDRSFHVAPFGLTKRYSIRLEHDAVAIGVSLSESNVPALRIQPRAEFIHAVGPGAVVDWCREVATDLFAGVELSASRIDLFSDWQGWRPVAADEPRFVTRARQRGWFAEDGAFTGFTFGRRSSGTLSSRIYDKTRLAAKRGVTFWPDVWDESFDSSQPVWRVEFECNRQLLHQFGLTGPPEQVLAARGDLWEYATDWLSLRDPIADSTRHRWPLAPEWERIRRAELRNVAIGVERMTGRRDASDLYRLVPGLVGYLASLGALLRRESLGEVLASLRSVVREYDARSGRSFEGRVAAKLAAIPPQ
jgi:hypothetical protein